MMKIQEMRKKSLEELAQELLNLSRVKFELRMQKAAGQLSKVSEIRKIKLEIARVKTVLGEKGMLR